MHMQMIWDSSHIFSSLVDEGTEAKGTVILAVGGGHAYRSNVEEAYESAKALNERGYQCFIVNYRVDSYADEKSALDYARAVRYVRANAEKYGVDEDKIAGAVFLWWNCNLNRRKFLCWGY